VAADTNGPLPSSLYDHWFRSFTDHAGRTVHVYYRAAAIVITWRSRFKALGMALHDALIDSGVRVQHQGRRTMVIDDHAAVIVCLDVKGGRVVKGVQFESLRDVAIRSCSRSATKPPAPTRSCISDISASAEERATMLDLARRTAERLFSSADDRWRHSIVRTNVARALRAGA
jgi:hypothetical protein